MHLQEYITCICKNILIIFLIKYLYLGVMCLHGKVLVAGGAIGVAPVSSCEKLPPCLIEPMPASSDGPTAGQGQANQRRW